MKRRTPILTNRNYEWCSSQLTRMCVAATLLGTTLAASTASAQKTGVIVETVTAYGGDAGAGLCPGTSDQNGADPSGAEFQYQMTNNWTYFTPFMCGTEPCVLTDGNVDEYQFYDPDLTHNYAFLDDLYFDAVDPQLAISFFQGHGTPGNKGGGTGGAFVDILCTSQAQCWSPPSPNVTGNSGFGTCVMSPASFSAYGPNVGICQWEDQRAIVTCSADNQGAPGAQGDLGFSLLNNTALQTGSSMALGENATVGNWRGASTNGGTSLAIVKNSNTMLSMFPSEWQQLFAGLHLFFGMMVSDGDSCDSPSFGGAASDGYVVNPFSQVASVLSNSISSVVDGGGCTAPGSGFNGCGCHFVITYTNAATAGASPIYENWLALRNDNANQTSAAFEYWLYTCNYNPVDYPLLGGDLVPTGAL